MKALQEGGRAIIVRRVLWRAKTPYPQIYMSLDITVWHVRTEQLNYDRTYGLDFLPAPTVTVTFTVEQLYTIPVQYIHLTTDRIGILYIY